MEGGEGDESAKAADPLILEGLAQLDIGTGRTVPLIIVLGHRRKRRVEAVKVILRITAVTQKSFLGVILGEADTTGAENTDVNALVVNAADGTTVRLPFAPGSRLPTLTLVSASSCPSPPAVVAHADWSVDPRKRRVARAVRTERGGYTALAPEPVGSLDDFLDRLAAAAGSASGAAVTAATAAAVAGTSSSRCLMTGLSFESSSVSMTAV